MQFGHALNCLLCEILLLDAKNGPIDLMKVHISDSFYCILVVANDIPKLGVIFSTGLSQEPLIALPLVLPMGWKNSSPIFTTATETVADLANQHIQDPSHIPLLHHLNKQAQEVSLPAPLNAKDFLATMPSHNLSLPSPQDPPGYVDVFVDDLLALVPGVKSKKQVHQILFHAINQVF